MGSSSSWVSEDLSTHVQFIGDGDLTLLQSLILLRCRSFVLKVRCESLRKRVQRVLDVLYKIRQSSQERLGRRSWTCLWALLLLCFLFGSSSGIHILSVLFKYNCVSLPRLVASLPVPFLVFADVFTRGC